LTATGELSHLFIRFPVFDEAHHVVDQVGYRLVSSLGVQRLRPFARLHDLLDAVSGSFRHRIPEQP